MDNGYFEKIDGGHEVYITKEYGFTSDTLILAHFARPKKNYICADFGTGCGMIAFLWKARINPKMIYGLDIQEKAVDQANYTMEHGGFEGMEFINADIKTIKETQKEKIPSESLDIIACNPPYKAEGRGLSSPKESRAIAWNEHTLTMEELAKSSAYALKFGGRLCICQRVERLAEIMRIFADSGLEPKRLQMVQQNKNAAPTLFLLEARKGGKSGLVAEPALMVTENGRFTPEMKEVYGGYYNGK